MSLIVNTLSITRQQRLILDNVSFEVADGTALLLRGPNGVGKTTLLRALVGLIPASGELKHNGAPLAAARDAYLEGIALSGHLDALKPAMTVAETLTFWAGLYGQSPKGITEAFDLTHLAKRPTARLSAGQKRRLGLARLPLSGASLWLMDEPTVSLDVENTARLTATLRTHLAKGGKAVISTHLPLDLENATTLTLSPPQANAPQDPFLEGTLA